MIDIHTHIINEIDDGSRSFLESVSILKKLSSLGFTKVIATPHYIPGSKYQVNNRTKEEKLKIIQDTLENENIFLDLYLGNEIFIDPNVLSFIKANDIDVLGNSRYLLIELPVHQMMNEMLDILFRIRNAGFIPIIAHPERYLYLQENHELILKFLEMGCLFQGNFENMVAKYGHHAKKLFLYMLKNNQYHFLATDVHHEDDILFKNFKGVKKSICKLITEEKFRELTEVNPQKVLENKRITSESIS